MQLSKQLATGFDTYAFEQASCSISTLKARLPVDAVAALAREVVLRLASRAIELEGSHVRAPSSADIETLCLALIRDDLEAGARYIGKVRDQGASLEQVYLSYLAAAARMLGDWWDTDRASFAEVTIATSRIYAIMRGLRSVIAPLTGKTHRAAVFASVPDETHTLGVTMAADLFRRNGWEISLKVGLTHEELIDYFKGSACKVIGLSASGQATLLQLARLIVALRISNPQALIMVSGKIVGEEGETVAHLGADSVATDVPSALSEMDRLMFQAQASATAAG